MAQKRRSLRRRAALLAKRYGLVGKGRVLATCVVCVVALTGIGLARLATRPAVTIERDVDAVASSDAGDGGDASAVGATTYATRNEEGPAKQTNEAEGETPGIAHVVVHVDGAVANPGVYDVANDVPRVNDAIVLAGGLAEDADTSSLNLASPLQDGQKVHVPHEGEEPAQALSQTASPTSEHADAEAASRSSLVNINTATVEELQALPGVGAATAASIVEEREANGAFAAPEDLMRVSGIGEKRFAKMRGMICV